MRTIKNYALSLGGKNKYTKVLATQIDLNM